MWSFRRPRSPPRKSLEPTDARNKEYTSLLREIQNPSRKKFVTPNRVTKWTPQWFDPIHRRPVFFHPRRPVVVRDVVTLTAPQADVGGDTRCAEKRSKYGTSLLLHFRPPDSHGICPINPSHNSKCHKPVNRQVYETEMEALTIYSKGAKK